MRVHVILLPPANACPKKSSIAVDFPEPWYPTKMISGAAHSFSVCNLTHFSVYESKNSDLLSCHPRYLVETFVCTSGEVHV